MSYAVISIALEILQVARRPLSTSEIARIAEPELKAYEFPAYRSKMNGSLNDAAKDGHVVKLRYCDDGSSVYWTLPGQDIPIGYIPYRGRINGQW